VDQPEPATEPVRRRRPNRAVLVAAPAHLWAETLRFHGVTNPDEAREWIQRPWVANLDLPDDTLEIDFDNAAAHGLDPDALVDDDHARCQRWVTTLDVPAIVVPSAALPGTRNIVAFGPRVRARYGVTPLDPGLDVPCDPVADVSIVVADLLAHIRWRGAPHAGYEAWLAGAAPVVAPSVQVS
jgi:hypothetical protein